MATCEEFVITIKNACDGEIQATKLEYKDGARWRRQAMFGLRGHHTIGKDRKLTFQPHALSGVGDAATQLRVTYNHRHGAAQRSLTRVETTHPFMARSHGKKTIVLTR